MNRDWLDFGIIARLLIVVNVILFILVIVKLDQKKQKDSWDFVQVNDNTYMAVPSVNDEQKGILLEIVNKPSSNLEKKWKLVQANDSIYMASPLYNNGQKPILFKKIQ